MIQVGGEGGGEHPQAVCLFLDAAVFVSTLQRVCIQAMRAAFCTRSSREGPPAWQCLESSQATHSHCCCCCRFCSATPLLLLLLLPPSAAALQTCARRLLLHMSAATCLSSTQVCVCGC